MGRIRYWYWGRQNTRKMKGEGNTTVINGLGEGGKEKVRKGKGKDIKMVGGKAKHLKGMGGLS